MLDTALCDLLHMCKVGLSLTVNALEFFGKYFRFILQGGGEGSGMAQSCIHCEMLDYACTAHFLSWKLTSPKKKPCALLDFTYFI